MAGQDRPNEPTRWVVAILAVAAILALVAYARGAEQRDEPVSPEAAAIVVRA